MRPPRAARHTGASKWLWWLATNTAGPLSLARLRLPITVNGEMNLSTGTRAPYWMPLRIRRAGGVRAQEEVGTDPRPREPPARAAWLCSRSLTWPPGPGVLIIQPDRPAGGAVTGPWPGAPPAGPPPRPRRPRPAGRGHHRSARPATPRPAGRPPAPAHRAAHPGFPGPLRQAGTGPGSRSS